ncbi:MAG: hypothetical protein BA870_08215 [Desulfuromonadales bacterium C00003094]|jgi:uncharacterized protein|nr:MAG: hypothetical protein BA870_08215 [Desulfuromonadales bacterium C00003094]
MEEEMDVTVDQESKNMALLIWIGTIFFGFIPGLVFYLVKKDDPYVLNQSKESLNWSITLLIGYAAGLILSMILVGLLVLLALAIIHLVFCVMGAVACSDGKDFKVPYTLRLIK